MGPRPIVGRLAPSPTGSLHLGHAYSFLAAWWSARARGGRVVLRLEDLDAGRAHRDHIDAALFDLKWLGLDWDGPPIIQSERAPSLRAAAEQLLEKGLAYPCVCTRKDLLTAHAAEEEVGAPQEGLTEKPYPGTCRDKFETLVQAEAESGKEAGLRFKVPSSVIEVVDGVYGVHPVHVKAQAGDFQILRRDKTPAYQLSVVVDDAKDEVTEVIRGRDLLDSSARQKCLSEALGLDLPQYFHLPLICDHTGRRLAKRENALSLHALRQQGATASQIVAWAARSLGQNVTSSPTLAPSTLGAFEPAQIPRNDVLLPVEVHQALSL